MRPEHEPTKALSQKETMELFERKHFAHLACHFKNDLYLVPINYAFHDGTIYSHTGAGKKIEIMRKNPHVCIQVDDVQSYFEWKSAIAWGEFEELRGDEAAQATRLLIQQFSEKETTSRKSDLVADFPEQLGSAILFKVKIKECTGRFEGVP